MPNTMITITRGELKQLIQDAVREEFIHVGLRAETPDQAEQTRQDLSFLRFLRHSRDGMGKAAGNAIMAAIVAGFLGLLYLGFKVKVGSP